MKGMKADVDTKVFVEQVAELAMRLGGRYLADKLPHFTTLQ